MEAYTGFAEVYDKFMDNIDYPMWCHYLCELLKDNGVETGTLVELGCGTGNVTMGLAKEGYNIIGTDISPEMLGIAFEKLTDEVRNNILYVAMDMRKLELPCQVAAAVSICDSINYITEYDDLVTVIKGVKKYLAPEGVFIFDLKTGLLLPCQSLVQTHMFCFQPYHTYRCTVLFYITVCYFFQRPQVFHLYHKNSLFPHPLMNYHNRFSHVYM